MSDDQLRSAVAATSESQKSKLYAASRLSRFFEINLTIKLFGFTIVNFKFPPDVSQETPSIVESENDLED